MKTLLYAPVIITDNAVGDGITVRGLNEEDALSAVVDFASCNIVIWGCKEINATIPLLWNIDMVVENTIYYCIVR